ncbi:MAG: hypothetical protein HZC55_10355 [Verrucomicrobia bacterium]|nr:hypothetical protein [Verrucomicrobiota bacterium]
MEKILRLILRLVGSAALLAVLAVVMPYEMMDAIHGRLGLGRLPADPIVGYLARSLSAFYALVGALMWMLSGDVRRHRPTILFLGGAFIVFGIVLVGVDWVEGLPLWWRCGEGPWVSLIGVAIAWTASRVPPAAD